MSFDIGIKNMAYCIFDLGESMQLDILDWGVLNLMASKGESTEILYCNAPKTSSSKKKAASSSAKKAALGEVINTATNQSIVLCGLAAKYSKGDHYYCMKHAKASAYMMPSKNFEASHLKKKKVDELVQLASSHSIVFPDGTLKKAMVDALLSYYETHGLREIVAKKHRSAGDIDLITIGRNMCSLLNQIPYISTITHVAIENQISPIANRMKTLQGMLTQYFIMRGMPDIHIDFISSANKLKGFSVSSETNENADDKTKYTKHKKDGIQVCTQFLDANPQWTEWKQMFSTVHTHGNKAPLQKRDDLADSFLQGIWYMKSRKIITYAENLKINSVFLE